MQITGDLTDAAVLGELGKRLARTRLDLDLTQQGLADEAGISRDTVLRLEDGQSVTLTAFLRVLRALRLLEGVDRLVPEPLPSPIEQLEREGKRRRRASGSRRKANAQDAGVWEWGTE
jgi:transcriptional regulator with XRE-family HTH domain